MITTLPDYQTLPGHRLGLKVVYADGRPESDKAPPDFRWPLTVGATVTAPDWRPDNECGGGLHVWCDGGGDLAASGLHRCDDATVTWLAVDYDEADAIDLDGKVKVRECMVVAVGVRADVASWIAARVRTPVHYAVVTAGDEGTATAGYRGTATAGNDGTATAGDFGTATAGNRGTATAGNDGTATAGDFGTATAGNDGTATAGYNGTATAGNRGTATAGNDGTATAGYNGTATAGYNGTATAGDFGTATAGNDGTASAGLGGCINILWFDAAQGRYRRAVAEVDGVTIKPGVKYRVEGGRFVEVSS